MANNSNFSGWSGFTNLLSGNTPYESFKNKPQQSATPNSPITVGPVNIVSTPKNGPARDNTSEPVYQTGGTQTQRFSSLSSVSVVRELNLPYTAGTVDYSFPAGGGFSEDGFNGSVYHIAVDANGKYVVGGGFTTYYYNGTSYTSNRLIRLNTDGTVDESFDISFNEDCYGGGFNDTVYTLEIQPDGKILVGGEFDQFDRDGNCNTFNQIIRLNSDGSRDTPFNIGNGFNGTVFDIHVQPNGKILVGGEFTQYNGTDAYRIIRLNSNGSIDSSFLIGNDSVAFNNYVNVIELQSDGKILVGGYFTTYGNVNQNYITRLNTNGTLDTTFRVGNGFNEEVMTLALQSDGKIIVGGYFDEFDNNDLFYGKIVRLDSNGSLDTLFGHGLNNQVHSLAIQSDDKILVGGYFGTYIINNSSTVSVDELVRFNSDCSFDYSFYYGEMLNDGVEYISILEDGNVLIGGFFNNFDGPDPLVFPLNYFGRLHNAILEYPYTYIVEDCEEPINGSPIYYTVGSMTELNTTSTYSFTKLSNPSVTVCGTVNLSLYPSMNIDYEMVEEYVNCDSALLSNSKYASVSDMLDFGEGYTLTVDNKYEVGDILYVDIIFDFIDGPAFIKTVVQIDSFTFGEGGFPSPIIPYQPYESVTEAVIANGVHYEVRDTCETNDMSHYPLIHKEWYDNTTILLPTFETIACKEVVNVLTFAPYFLISGGTEEIYSVVEFENCDECLTKMGKTGLLDTTLYNNNFNNLVYTMVEQPDGKLLIAGNFDEVNGNVTGPLVRLNYDGTIDTTFNDGGIGFDEYVRAIALQEDGKILVGGNFHEYNGRVCPDHFVRLNSDGSLDETFNDLGLNNLVRAIAIQGDGKIVVGGEFNEYGNEHPSNRLIRIDSDGNHDDSFVIGDGFNGGVFSINIETVLNSQFYHIDANPQYVYNIIVGGWFDEYQGVRTGGIAKLSETGELSNSFGTGFNYGEGDNPRVNQILKQDDGKLVIVGGADGGHLIDYQGTFIPRNIVRLEEDGFGQYNIDSSFDVPPFYFGEGGFNNGYALSVVQQPDGKLIVGGNFDDYQDDNDEYTNLYNIVRLNTNGSYDSTFSMGEGFDGQVNKVLLLSDGKLLTGGRYNDYPTDNLTRLYIGEEYKLYNFTDCNGDEGYTYLPRTFSGSSTTSTTFSATPITYELISTDGLDLVYDGDEDDDDWQVALPTPFDINFLGVNYTSVNVSTNPYITFGDGGNPSDCCFDIPNGIPNNVELPGVFLSFQCQSPPSDPGDYDADMLQLYTGLTDGGNTLIIKYFGQDHCNDVIPLNYTFRFYKDNSDYFDLLIDENTLFFNDDPTGGISNGVDESWLATFDSTGGNAYRIGNNTSSTVVKSNLGDTPTYCGSVGSETNTVIKRGGQGGSMYFDGTGGTNITIDYNVAMDLDYSSWTVEWFQYYTSTDTCCRRVFDIGSFSNEHFGVSLEDGSIVVWLERPSGPQFSYTLLNPISNNWSHFAITSEDIGGNERRLRVFQNGVELGSFQVIGFDMNNFDGPTLLPLTIGSEGSGGSPFEGYITNFRWNKGTCYYTSNFTVPTTPLTVDGSQLLLLATSQSGLTYDSSETQTVSQNNVTWSELNPFGTEVRFYNTNDLTTYDDCDTCKLTVFYKSTLYVRDGISNYVERFLMTSDDIANVLTYGPIFTTSVGNETARQNYEILHYNL